MPYYELNLLVKPIKDQQLVSCLKRAAQMIWTELGSIEKIEYLGCKPLPHNIKQTGHKPITQGNYFIYHINIGSTKLPRLYPELKNDIDLLKANFYIKDQSIISPDYQCTLDEELQPPVHRKSLQPLLSEKNFRIVARK